MRSFNNLLLANGYDAITPADVAEEAGVARSTLYEHFAGKEGLLRHSLLPILEPLASCAGSRGLPPQLEPTLQHIRSSRRMARELLRGRARIVTSRTFAEILEERLPGCDDLPRPLTAAFLAGGILSMINDWLEGRAGCSPQTLARAVHSSAQSVVVGSGEILLREDSSSSPE